MTQRRRDDGTEETDGSDIEDMTAAATQRGKAQQSPAKSSKKESAMENYTEADIAIVRADRYAHDFPAMQNYRNNVALPSDMNCLQPGQPPGLFGYSDCHPRHHLESRV